ncbi:hypothetical protein GCM10011492_05080 [Flexivirga endophytica]|uniref:Uncharacterized protein n=1 Tax=Flexivirga endophytica TaxID=1849103 RepID=A0A916SVH3_9MICO|nr:hypothetical protein GCM10011492_05080 [Flexivirga endophytica]GHB37399.1 hypothetical protein GCM10008112_02530 [Flexivirga endophytica]
MLPKWWSLGREFGLSTEKKTVDRRTIAKGAAWTLPVIATAAAAPAASASTNPTCPQCGVPILNVVTATAGVKKNVGDLVIPVGAFVANLAGCTGLINASVLTANSATLTMKYSNGSTKSYTTTNGLSVGVSATVATVLAEAALTFTGVDFPRGSFLNPPVQPSSVSFDVVILLEILGKRLECPQTITFNFDLSVGGYAVGPGGNGSAAYLLAGLL